jgi:hypothetical protein
MKTKTCARFEVLRVLFLKIPSLLGCDSVFLDEWFPKVSEERFAMRGYSHWTDWRTLKKTAIRRQPFAEDRSFTSHHTCLDTNISRTKNAYNLVDNGNAVMYFPFRQMADTSCARPILMMACLFADLFAHRSRSLHSVMECGSSLFWRTVLPAHTECSLNLKQKLALSQTFNELSFCHQLWTALHLATNETRQLGKSSDSGAGEGGYWRWDEAIASHCGDGCPGMWDSVVWYSSTSSLHLKGRWHLSTKQAVISQKSNIFSNLKLQKAHFCSHVKAILSRSVKTHLDASGR